MNQAIAILKLEADEALIPEAEKLLAETRLPSGVTLGKRRLRSTDPQALFESVSSIVDRAYRHGRRATMGSRGKMGFRAGIAVDADPEEGMLRATSLCGAAAPHVILADEAFVQSLDPLRGLPFDRTSPQTIDGCTAYATFAPDQRDCFVIMPMGMADSEVRARSERVLNDLVHPACKALGLRPIAPTRQAGEQISIDVFGALHLSTLVVAYLGETPWNPNVMIEVGYRLAVGRPLVLLASEPPPFDLGNRRAVFLTDGWPRRPEPLIRELTDAMQDRLENGVEGSDLYPTAEIEVDERNVPEERKRHRIAAVSEATATLFGLPREILVGMSPTDLITHLGELIGDQAQFDAFQEEQGDLYTQLASLGLGMATTQRRTNVSATVPLTFFTHPDRTFNGRAFLPYVISQSRRPGLSSTQRVVYVEVTHAVRRRTFRRHGEVRMCELNNRNGGLAFELYARSYDEILTRLTNYREVRDRHVRRIVAHCSGGAITARILDLGAGTGNVTIPLVEHGFDVCAIDLSQAMLDRLSAKLSAHPGSRLHVERRDCRSLRTFGDGSFDAVTMSLVLFAIGERGAARDALAEATRVLKPGGLLIVTEPKSTFRLEPLVEQAEAELRNVPEWPSLQRHWDTVRQANSIINPEGSDFLPAEEIYDLLRSGFEGLDACDAYQGNCWTLTGRKVAACTR